jgi:hypothetical protein
MTAADYAALEARVSELEHQMRQVLPHRVDAVAYGLSLVHEDLRAFRDEMTEFRGETRMRLDRHGELLDEILRRLPSRPSNGPAGEAK